MASLTPKGYCVFSDPVRGSKNGGRGHNCRFSNLPRQRCLWFWIINQDGNHYDVFNLKCICHFLNKEFLHVVNVCLNSFHWVLPLYFPVFIGSFWIACVFLCVCLWGFDFHSFVCTIPLCFPEILPLLDLVTFQLDLLGPCCALISPH